MNADRKRRLRRLGHMVGNTPLLRLDVTFRGAPRRVYAKAEHLNLTGSIKDRMALHVIRAAYEDGSLVPGARIIEATSGNAGISLASIGRALGHPVTIFMPDWLSIERGNLLRSLGAEVRLVGRADGGFETCLEGADELAAATPDTFRSDQFANPANVEAHAQTTGPELLWQLHFEGIEPTAFIAGVGTGGTVMGVGRFLKGELPEVRVHPLEPVSSPTLTVGHKVGSHRIQGISDEFVPPIVDLDTLDDIVAVDDGDSIVMAQRLAAELGLGVGISSGANLLGALLVAENAGPDAVVATVFADDNKKYLSTALLRDEPVGEDFLSIDVELHGFEAIKRVCFVCCDGEDCERLDADFGDDAPYCARRQA